MSLRVRINLIMTLLIVAFSLVTAKIVLDDARRQIREEMEAGTKVTLQLLTTVLYSSQFVPPSENAPNGVLLGFLTQLGRVRANEIRMFAPDGTLLYTSPPPVYKAGRSAPQWFTDLVSPRTQQVMLSVKGGRIVITPDPSRSILDAWDDMRNLIWLALLFLVLVNGVVFWLLGRALQPVGTILRGLSQMERGQLDARLPRFSLPEFDAIGQTFNRMAGALEESHAENTRLALVAKQSSDAIMIHDLEGNISFWNPAAERLFGYRPSEIVGHSAKVLTAPGFEDEVSANLETIRSRKTVENLDTKRRTRDGRVVDVALSAAPLIDPATGEVIGEICGMRDITEHRRAQQTERELEQNRRLTQLIQTRLEEERRAIARELHDELGQCVTAIKTIGAAIANRAKESSSEIHASAQTIVSVAAHIYDVVHGIIRQLRPSALDHLGLREAVEDLVNIWRGRHPEIACELTLRGAIDGLGEAINITVYRLIQECLTNILRHAKASRAQIEVRREASTLLVSVADNGQGLGERGQSESERFGLMGMRERVQALGGEFNLESRPGVGLTVTASIPVQDSDSNPAVGDESESDRSGHDQSGRGDVQVIAEINDARIRVMLVDDHAVVRMGFRLLLEGAPDIAVVGEADSGEEAVRTFGELKPDVIVMDIAMPGIGGLEAIDRIHAREPQARILVLSAHEDAMHARRVMKSGAVGYLTKRSAAEELIQAIRQVALGKTYLEPSIAQQLAMQQLNGEKSPVDMLSEKEFKVFLALAKGQSVADIAEIMSLSPRTVGTHLYNIKQKLGASNSAELAIIAIRAGLIAP